MALHLFYLHYMKGKLMKKKNNIYKRIGALLVATLVCVLTVLPCFADSDQTEAQASSMSALEAEMNRHFFEAKNFWRGQAFERTEEHADGTKSYVESNGDDTLILFDESLSSHATLFQSLDTGSTTTYIPTPEEYGCAYTVFSVYFSNPDESNGYDLRDFEAHFSKMEVYESYHNHGVYPTLNIRFYPVGYLEAENKVYYVFSLVTSKKNDKFNDIHLGYDFDSVFPFELQCEVTMSYVSSAWLDSHQNDADEALLHANFLDANGEPSAPITDDYILQKKKSISDFLSYMDSLGYVADFENGYDLGYNRGFAEGKPNGTTAGYNEGYAGGKAQGYNEGYADGSSDGYDLGYDSGYETGSTTGYTDGKAEGYADGKTQGYNEGYTDGVEVGEADGWNLGYANGESEGYTDGKAEGYTDGRGEGYGVGYEAGKPDGYNAGFEEGETEGYNVGYLSGSADGYDAGYTDGRGEGYGVGYEEGKPDGYDDGYTLGYDEGMELTYQAYDQAQKDLLNTLEKNQGNLIDNLGNSDGSFTEGFLAGMWNGMTSFTQTLLSGFTLSGLSLQNILTTLLALMVAAYIIRLVKG